MDMAIPDALKTLRSTYAAYEPASVRFRPASWERHAPNDSGLLRGDLTIPCIGRYAATDRTIHARELTAAGVALDLEDEGKLRSTFVAVMAWGSGTSLGGRSYGNTHRALSDPRLNTALADSASLCRGEDVHGLAEAYKGWRVDGVGPSFFTKWFRFAGHIPARGWQPLILDDRVLRSLRACLGITSQDLAPDNKRSTGYVGYVEMLSSWAKALDEDSTRLEWILFCHNGNSNLEQASSRAGTPAR